MPKDDWAKYARRDRGRQALATGEYFRAGSQSAPPKKRKNRKKKKTRATAGGFVIEYNKRTPELSNLRTISGQLAGGFPPWPGFT